ncbi:hypothetical protein A5739_24830 [Mycobacterium colombiense]|nr:hypothetical protein A5739_24830 [Mycobacterium colombiense]
MEKYLPAARFPSLSFSGRFLGLRLVLETGCFGAGFWLWPLLAWRHVLDPPEDVTAPLAAPPPCGWGRTISRSDSWAAATSSCQRRP